MNKITKKTTTYKKKITYKKKPFKNTYNKKDYNSEQGMLTSVWGPSLWHFLHVMSFNYPVKPTKIQKKKLQRIYI